MHGGRPAGGLCTAHSTHWAGAVCCAAPEADRVDRPRVPLLQQELLAALGVPQAPGGVEAGGGDVPPRRVVRHAREPADVPLELAERLAALERPELGGAVAARGDQVGGGGRQAARARVRVPREARDALGVPLERADRLALRHAPQLHQRRPRAGRDHARARSEGHEGDGPVVAKVGELVLDGPQPAREPLVRGLVRGHVRALALDALALREQPPLRPRQRVARHPLARLAQRRRALGEEGLGALLAGLLTGARGRRVHRVALSKAIDDRFGSARRFVRCVQVEVGRHHLAQAFATLGNVLAEEADGLAVLAQLDLHVVVVGRHGHLSRALALLYRHLELLLPRDGRLRRRGELVRGGGRRGGRPLLRALQLRHPRLRLLLECREPVAHDSDGVRRGAPREACACMCLLCLYGRNAAKAIAIARSEGSRPTRTWTPE